MPIKFDVMSYATASLLGGPTRRKIALRPFGVIIRPGVPIAMTRNAERAAELARCTPALRSSRPGRRRGACRSRTSWRPFASSPTRHAGQSAWAASTRPCRRFVLGPIAADNLFIALHDEELAALNFAYDSNDGIDPLSGDPTLWEKIGTETKGLTAYVALAGEALLVTPAVRDELARSGWFVPDDRERDARP